MKTRVLDTTHFEDAEKYAAYLKTPLGRLRSELAWENLCEFLPSESAGRHALDLGGGTGWTSLRLAGLGFSVALLDSSQEMLAIAKKEAETRGITGRISFQHADANALQELFTEESFDLVVCHNLLEFVSDPEAIIAKIAHVLRKNGVVTVLVRSRAGEVLKAAIKSGDFALAKAALSAETVLDSLYGKPLRVFEPHIVMLMFARAGLDVIAQRGVRVFADYRDPKDLEDEATYRPIFELELLLASQPESAGIARYTQLIARRSSAPPKRESAR